MLPECWRADPDIYCHIEDRASHYAHELALSMRRRLKMQTADGARFRREYVIVLNELYRHACCDQCPAIVGLGEKAPRVAMNSRSHELDLGDMQRPYFQDNPRGGSGRTRSFASSAIWHRRKFQASSERES